MVSKVGVSSEVIVKLRNSFRILTVRPMLMEGRSRKIMGTKVKVKMEVVNVILARVGIRG